MKAEEGHEAISYLEGYQEGKKAGYEEGELVEVSLAGLLEKSYKAGKKEVLREILPRMKEALRASTHDANDYNCEDWPLGEGCSGCKGDEVRKQAIEWLATLAERMEIKGGVMREKKFRAWNASLGKMCEGQTIQQWLRVEHDNTIVECLVGISKRHGVDTEDEHYGYLIFLEYTGLKDKNDIEIYEGDIVLIPYYPTESNPIGEAGVGVVECVCGAFGYRAGGYHESFGSLYGEGDAYEEEVIGNVYENPELLK